MATNGIFPQNGTHAGSVSLFVQAASQGDYASVVQEKLKGIDINAPYGRFGATALHEAAYQGQLAIIDFLLGFSEIQINRMDTAGYTALAQACERGHLAVAARLLQQGASLYPSPHASQNPLHLAMKWNRARIVQLLSQYGAVLPQGYDLATALQEEAMREASQSQKAEFEQAGLFIRTIANKLQLQDKLQGILQKLQQQAISQDDFTKKQADFQSQFDIVLGRATDNFVNASRTRNLTQFLITAHNLMVELNSLGLLENGFNPELHLVSFAQFLIGIEIVDNSEQNGYVSPSQWAQMMNYRQLHETLQTDKAPSFADLMRQPQQANPMPQLNNHKKRTQNNINNNNHNNDDDDDEPDARIDRNNQSAKRQHLMSEDDRQEEALIRELLLKKR